MCLSSITKKYDPPLKTTCYAWKAFTVDEDPEFAATASRSLRYFAEYSPLTDDDLWPLPYPIRKWIKAKEETIRLNSAEDAITYTSGFHAFRKKKDAVRWVGDGIEAVVRVKLRGVHTEGDQDMHVLIGALSSAAPVLVAKEMLIPAGPRKPRK